MSDIPCHDPRCNLRHDGEKPIGCSCSALESEVASLRTQLSAATERAQRAEEKCAAYMKEADAQNERNKARAEAAEKERDEASFLRDEAHSGIRLALRELGVPGPGYPAPVAEAVKILNAADAILSGTVGEVRALPSPEGDGRKEAR